MGENVEKTAKVYLTLSICLRRLPDTKTAIVTLFICFVRGQPRPTADGQGFQRATGFTPRSTSDSSECAEGTRVLSKSSQSENSEKLDNIEQEQDGKRLILRSSLDFREVQPCGFLVA